MQSVQSVNYFKQKGKNMITITTEQAYEIIAFVKMHERDEIPDDLFDIIMDLQDKLDCLL